jgi:hypothetical protein
MTDHGVRYTQHKKQILNFKYKLKLNAAVG